MAYGLKYTQYLEKGGAQLQIRVYAKNWNGASYGMAHVTGASLHIIGGQSDVLSPYIKTAFSWSLADAWDQGTTQADGTNCVNAANEKCGKWEEFYTPDATKFRVELWAKTAPSSTAVCIWKGFVTPDSWSENLIYRGSVTITARDMLGALQDKEFDLIGRVSVLEVIQGALAACECPMELDYTAAHFLVNKNGSSILSHTFAASTFSGDTWQQALLDTLESLGLVLRYNGAGQFILTSLRYLAADTLSGSHNIEFINRTGLRELDPALKLITEIFDVDVVELSNPDPTAGQYAATGGMLTQKVVAHLSGGGTQTNTNYIPGYTLTESGGEGWSGSLAVPALGAVVDGAADRGIYFPTDIEDVVSATLRLPRMRGGSALKIEQDGGLVELGTRTGIGSVIRPCTSGHSIGEVRIRVEIVEGGTTKYLTASGSWSTTSTAFPVGVGQEVVVPEYDGVGAKIVIEKVVTENTMPAYFAILAALKVTISPGSDGASIISEYKTTTIYNEDNNVTITRRPVVGSASLGGCVDFYENVLALGDGIAQDEWNWPGESSFYPLAVMIHAQALCFHAAAASVFTGTMHDKAAPEALAFPGCAYSYYDRNCVPVYGTFDFTSGFVAQTFLREVYSWEEVWGTFAPDYTQISGSGKGSTSATGAGGASIAPGGGGGGTGGGTNYFEPDSSFSAGINLKNNYDAIRVPGIRFGAGDQSALDLYVDFVRNSQGNDVRVLRTPLTLITGGDQIVEGGTPGGGDTPVHYLYELTDVVISSVADGNLIVWDSTARSGQGAWVNIPQSSITPDLSNYYTKAQTYSQAEVNSLIGSINQFHYEIYASTSVVTNPQPNVLYLIGPTGSGSDKYEEYVYASSSWVKIGDTSIDLSGYMLTLNFTAANIVSTLGTTAVNRATGDAEGNAISSTYLKLSGGTMTGTLKLTAGVGIEDAASGNGLLVYRPTSGWSGISSNQWGVGSASYQGVIRSSSVVVRYDGSNSYNVYDQSNANKSDVPWTCQYLTVNATAQTAYRAYIDGTIASTGDQVIVSDATKKTNWRPLEYTVEDIAKCTAGRFEWVDGHGMSVGTKAQDWKPLLPELVHGDEGNMTLAYGQIALLNTILLARHEAEHDKEISQLREMVEELEQRIR